MPMNPGLSVCLFCPFSVPLSFLSSQEFAYLLVATWPQNYLGLHSHPDFTL